jgi:hypothetical protein
MRLASILCASFVVALTLASGGAGAAAMGNTYMIGTAPGTTEADCTKAGGTVSTDAHGNKICTLPKSMSPSGAREPNN